MRSLDFETIGSFRWKYTIIKLKVCFVWKTKISEDHILSNKRIFTVNGRIHFVKYRILSVNDRMLSAGIVYFQSCFFHDRILYHPIWKIIIRTRKGQNWIKMGSTWIVWMTVWRRWTYCIIILACFWENMDE